MTVSRPKADAQFLRALQRAVKDATGPQRQGGASLTASELRALPTAATFGQQEAWLDLVDQAVAQGSPLGRGADRVIADARRATRGTLRTVDATTNQRALAPLVAALARAEGRAVAFRPISSMAGLFPPQRFGSVYEIPAGFDDAHRTFIAIPDGAARRPASGFDWNSTPLMPAHGFIVRQAPDGALSASPLVHLLTDADVVGETAAAWPRGLPRTLKTAASVSAGLAASAEATEALRFAVIVAAVAQGQFPDDATRDAFARLWAQSALHIESGAASPTGAPELRVRLQARHPQLDEVYQTATALIAFERDGLRVSMLTGTPLLEALWQKAVGDGQI